MKKNFKKVNQEKNKKDGHRLFAKPFRGGNGWAVIKRLLSQADPVSGLAVQGRYRLETGSFGSWGFSSSERAQQGNERAPRPLARGAFFISEGSGLLARPLL